MKKHRPRFLGPALALLGQAGGVVFRRRNLRFLGPAIVLVVFLLALRLLKGIVKDYSFAEIVDSVRQIPPGWIAAAVAMTVVNYLILVGYDFLAVRYVGERLRLWKVALASFTGYAFSYNIGATLAGTSIRYRLYSAWGVSPLKILQLLVILGLTFWFGVFALAGLVFVVDPPHMPGGNHAAVAGQHTTDEMVHWVVHTLNWLSQYMRPVGAVLLLIAVAYVGLAAWHKGSVKILRWTLPVPPLKLTIYQIVVASADLIVAALVLHMLMPRMPEIDFPKFLGIYMVAYVVVVLSHVPGGLGVLEPAILLFLPHHYRLEGFAALIVFRVIYFWAPLLIAGALLGAHEISLSTPPQRHCGRWPHRLAWPLAGATWLLILTGAMVTGYGAGMSVPDWPKTFNYWFYPLKLWLHSWDPFLEHGHRMLVALVGAMTLLLAVVVWRTDPRRWMRGIVVAAVGLLILQGLLGGLRVVADERLLARVHGCTAPLFFTLCAILVSATSTRWLSGNAAVEQPAARRMHRLLWAIAAGLYLEIVLGTLLRVPSFAIDRHWFGLLIWAKIVGAGLIAAALAWLWIASRRKVFGQPMIALRARLLAGLFLLQVVLACATWVTHYGWPAWFSGTFGTVRYTVVETGWWQVLLTTLHVGVGALLLALATTLALWSHRLWREVPS